MPFPQFSPFSCLILIPTFAEVPTLSSAQTQLYASYHTSIGTRFVVFIRGPHSHPCLSALQVLPSVPIPIPAYVSVPVLSSVKTVTS